jgi:hypothetical protein
MILRRHAGNWRDFLGCTCQGVEGSNIVRLGVGEFNLVNVRADSAPRSRGRYQAIVRRFSAHFQSQEYVRISLSDG